MDIKHELTNKTILVTGGAGFIGSHLCDKLLQRGARVICFDNLSTGSRYYIESHENNPRFTFIIGDVNNFLDLEKVFSRRDIDYVFHYAALVGVQRTIEQPFSVLEDVEGIKNICKLSAESGVKKIVYASSSEVYGNQKELPFSEHSSYHDTKNPYSLVKAMGESYMKHYHQLKGLPTVSLRLFNVYGPRQANSHYGFVVGIFISQVLRNMPPTVFKDGSQTRDFTFIDDNVEISIGALLSKDTDGEVMNIGTGRETSVLTLAQKIIDLSGKKIEPSFLHNIDICETPRRFADVSKMQKLIGFSPKTPLEKGLKLTFDWYKDSLPILSKLKEKDFKFYEHKEIVNKIK